MKYYDILVQGNDMNVSDLSECEKYICRDEMLIKKYTLDVSDLWGGYFDLLPKELLNIVWKYFEYTCIHKLIKYIRYFNNTEFDDSYDIDSLYNEYMEICVKLYKPIRDYAINNEIDGKHVLEFKRKYGSGGFYLYFNDKNTADIYNKKYKQLLQDKFDIIYQLTTGLYIPLRYGFGSIESIDSLAIAGFYFSYCGDYINNVWNLIRVNGYADIELDVEALLKL